MISIKNYIPWLIVLIITDEISALPFNQPQIPSNATWCENGTTFMNDSIIGGPARGFFVRYDDTVYVAAYPKSRILVWSKESIYPIRNLIVKLFEYTTLFVTMNGDIYFENGNKKGQIDKWTVNSTRSITVRTFSNHCRGLFIDTNNTLYCSIYDEHRVVKIPLDDNNATETTVAGTGSKGSASYKLDGCWGIFVDTNFDLYVADFHNSRIQIFKRGELNGTTVAGNGMPQNLTLKHPTDMILDADGYLYIADNKNHRIIRSGHCGFQCVIGCSAKRGSPPYELNTAYSIRLDSQGSLYVADEYNYRIQKFTLTSTSCTETPATTISTLDHITSTSSMAPTSQTPRELTSPIPPISLNTLGIGPYRNISDAPCDMLNPCLNNGICNNSNTTLLSYLCACPPGFNGSRCQIHDGPCKPNICWNNGTCENISSTNFTCLCELGWEGIHCERKVNYCHNITCENKGVCRPLFRNYTCECVGDNFYSGHHCEIKARKIIILNTISKSFAYIAIIAISTVAMFVIIMDILKYCFGIDPTREDLERIRRKKLAKKRKPVIQRFVYVNAPLSTQEPILTAEETAA